MSSSNCCFLTCVQVAQEADKVVWYYHLFKNFPQFVVIHTVKGFGVVNEAEVDVFLELSCFFFVVQWMLAWRRKWQPSPVFLPGESQGQGRLVGCCLWGRTESDTTEETEQQYQKQQDVGNLISGSSAFSKFSLNIWKFMVHGLLKPGLENFEHYFTSVWGECNCAVVWAFFGIAFLWDWNENWPFPVLWPLLSFPNLLAYWVQHFHSIIF